MNRPPRKQIKLEDDVMDYVEGLKKALGLPTRTAVIRYCIKQEYDRRVKGPQQ